MTLQRRLVFCLLVSGVLLFAGCLGEGDMEGAEQPAVEEAPGEEVPVPEGEYKFGLEEVSFEEIAEDIPGWFERAAAKGIGVVGLEVLNLEGYMIIDSPTLRDAGFSLSPEYGNLFPEILREAKRHNIKVVVMLESIAHIKSNFYPYSENIIQDKLTPEAVGQLVRELAAEAQRAGVKIAVDEEAFEDAYIDAISRASKERGVEYIHFFEDLNCRADVFLSEDYAYYPLDGRNSPEDQDYLRMLLQQGSYYGELGNLNVMYGAARGCGRAAGTLTAGGWGLGAKTHQNIALLRAVQFGPKLFFFVIAEGEEGPIYQDEVAYVQSYNFTKSLLPLVEEFGRRETDVRKPVANLIIDEPRGGEDIVDFFINAQLSSMGAVTNAILASGYDLIVTKSRPYEGASLYYVFSPGRVFDEEQELPASLAELAGVPVFYQVAGELPSTPNWRKVREALGLGGELEVLLNEDETSFFDPIPESVVYRFPSGEHEVKYGGYSLEVWLPEQAGRFSLGHYLHYINPDEVDAEVLLEGITARDEDRVFDDRTALIIKKGNLYFVNGGYLHLASSAILANIISGLGGTPVYNSPSYGYFTNGESRAVFFAPYDVDVDINLLGGAGVTEFDEHGNRVAEPGVKLEKGRLTGKVKRFHLVIVD